ncbi:uncharacterized protein EI90DRAFT_3030489 [Cantharellus anzutake]|uniref:uncharacterized protein n=1 Tax=Cantharellus anzutake TaxID=1750568 RepID=UPI001904C625|nr:uncharacterized protein EI90DRAFT_3030489 [Cantharellus anzutake]KAF8342862.1 hypothetical protein EI90DRAFT_3030489 [Cantharellus anzutake]
MWFQTGHCAKGVVFAIKPPHLDDHSFDAFRKRAIATGNTKVQHFLYAYTGWLFLASAFATAIKLKTHFVNYLDHS